MTIRVKDPDALLAWIGENLPKSFIRHITATQVDRDGAYEVKIELDDPTEAMLIKTFWDSEK